jgi:hypothetical protein
MNCRAGIAIVTVGGYGRILGRCVLTPQVARLPVHYQAAIS